MHHFAHAHNDLVTGDSIVGVSGKSAAATNKKQQAGEG
jgi:enoyl-CoA hydratase